MLPLTLGDSLNLNPNGYDGSEFMLAEPRIYLVATLDTKGIEAQFLRELLEGHGATVCLVDAGCIGDVSVSADIERAAVHEAAGESLTDLITRNDRGDAIKSAAKGVARLIGEHHREGRVSGVIGLGGSAGTSIATAAMRQLPIGVPKLMISTVASGQVRPYVGDKDIMMMNSVVDIAGINRISRSLFVRAAAAMTAMVEVVDSESSRNVSDDRPLIAASMFGVTTPCVQHARERLEREGYEVLVFHATGNGGQAMESLIEEGVFAGVLDITTTELADELVGGVLSAGPTRLTAAAKRGIPQVVSVGATDMVNFGPRDSVPSQFDGRLFYEHNPTVTLMRTTAEENQAIGNEIGEKLATAHGPVTLLLPARGVSAIDQTGEAFDDPVARSALFDSLKKYQDRIEIREAPLHINDPAFADQCVDRLLELIQART